MNRVLTISLAALLLAATAPAQSAPAQSGQPSVADVARQTKQQKGTPRRTFTNDDLPHDGVVNVGGNSSAPEPSDQPAVESSKPSTEQQPDKATAAQKNPAKEWQARIADQKKQVADLEHEIDLMQREEQLRVAQLYWDAGNRLRDDKKWTDDEQKYKDTLAEKNEKLTAAREKLDHMQDEARKAGAQGIE